MNLDQNGYSKQGRARDVEFSYASVDQHQSVDLVGLYLREIGRYPLLTPQQERALSRASKKGDDRATEKLVVR